MGTGYAFISYVREDADRVGQLHRILADTGVSVWRDTVDLRPGEDWRLMIRRAITDDALVFIACFSSHSAARAKSYQNEELALAIEQLRLWRPDVPWLIPVRFDDCSVPDYDLGGGRTLRSIQRADLFGDRCEAETDRLVTTVQRLLEQRSSDRDAEEKASPGPEMASLTPARHAPMSERPAELTVDTLIQQECNDVNHDALTVSPLELAGSRSGSAAINARSWGVWMT